MKTADTILFRCSQLGKIMVENSKTTLTEKQAETLSELQQKEKLTDKQKQYLEDLIAKRDAAPQLTKGVQTHLIDIFIREYYKRKEDTISKHTIKGNEREEDSITIVSRILKQFFTKNEVRNRNEFIQGEHDLHKIQDGKIVETLDTKTSWSMHTFLRAKHSKLDHDYFWQGVGYMALTGASKHSVCYCLVNGTSQAISDEKRKLAFQMNVLDDESEDYIQRCKQIEINHIFDREAFEKENPFFVWHTPGEEWTFDVPIHERFHRFEIERNEKDIQSIFEQVKLCRSWLNENLFQKLLQF